MKFRFTSDIKFEADSLSDAESKLYGYFAAAAADHAKGESDGGLRPALAPILDLTTDPESHLMLDCVDDPATQELARTVYAQDGVNREVRKSVFLAEYADLFPGGPPVDFAKQP